MDVTNALRGDAFRPFATLVAPGAFGVLPFAYYFYGRVADARAFWDLHPVATGMALFIGSLAAGLVFENIGARIEVWIDRRIAKVDKAHFEYWQRYLLLVLEPEPIGQRYLRTLLFRMKFELGILGSLPAQALGWLLVLTATGTSVVVRIAVMAGCAVVAVWFYLEAIDSARNLSVLRRRIVDEFAGRR
jgi:hypothetical protein